MNDLDDPDDAQLRSSEPFKDSTNQLAPESLLDQPDFPAGSPVPHWQPTRATTLLTEFPPEILGMIFERSAGSCRDNVFPRPEALMQPFQCAAVCSRWRAVALATKGLWNQITIQSCWSPVRAAHVRRFAELALSRSGSYPLDVVVSWLSEKPAITPIYMEILTMLAEHCSRWRTLTIFGEEEGVFPRYFEPPLQFLGQRTPMLEEVHLDFQFMLDEDTAKPPNFGVCLPYAPKLRIAELIDVPAIFDPRRSQFEQATTLILDDSIYYLSRFICTLCCFPFVSTLRFPWRTIAVDVLHPPPHLVLPRLEALIFDNPMPWPRTWDSNRYDEGVYRFMKDVRTGMSCILDMIVAPKLRALIAQVECLPFLQDFIYSAPDSLEYIDLSGLQPASLLEAVAASILEGASQLRRLRLAQCELTREFLLELCAVAEDIWPQLREMNLDSVQYDGQRLLRFLNKRYPPHEAARVSLPVVAVHLNGDTIRDSPTALEISSLLDNERARRSLPTVAPLVQDN